MDYWCRQFIFSLDLSYLGNLEIIIKNNKAGINISIFCENDTGIKELKSDIDVLQSRVKKLINKEVYIFFYNSESVREKIIEINSSLTINNVLDVRV